MSIVSKWIQMACPLQEPFPCGSSPFGDEKIDQGSLGHLQNVDNTSIEVQVRETSQTSHLQEIRPGSSSTLRWLSILSRGLWSTSRLGAWGSEPLERSEPSLLCSASGFRPRFRLTNRPRFYKRAFCSSHLGVLYNTSSSPHAWPGQRKTPNLAVKWYKSCLSAWMCRSSQPTWSGRAIGNGLKPCKAKVMIVAKQTVSIFHNFRR